MKKFILALVALLTITVSANAMSYEQAREQALFLTDKMAYELNLTDEQYEAAYEVNLDYLLSVNDYSDLYGTYWSQRNLDLQYILLDWQYRSYLNALYFYRPLHWDAGYWHFRIYARYPHRDYFYFGRPHFYAVYRGGHSWHHNGGRSWYQGRTFAHSRGGNHFGMRDGFSRGDYGRGWSSRGNQRDNNRTFGNMREGDRNVGSRSMGNRSIGNRNVESRSNGSFGGSRSGSFGSSSRSSIENRGNFGTGSRQSSTRSTVTRPSSGSFGGHGSFGNSSSSRSSAPASTFSPSRSSGSFGGGSSSRGGGFSGGSRSMGGSSSRGNRGGSFGGHR